ncbi:MAG: hypothetical protein KKF41_13855 [Actinobacteria bacterium]|nr:hypothetical protein [Actinomycetota bacterium]MBU1944495.1 hypothetical protein [Actinomycetota bacterium]MBU2688660.1 hypothetical protein [Actinomycetota bacterium]
MRATIVIPTYWGRPSTEMVRPEDAVYDHPTELDSTGTLEQALHSITVLDSKDFNVVVLACATSPDIAEKVEEKVKGIAGTFRGYFPVAVVSHGFESRLKDRVGEAAGGELAELGPEMLSLTGYSNIRNMCLVAAELARSEVAVLFDDDQVYEDKHYLDKVFENIGREIDGKFLGTIAGYYIRADETIYPQPCTEHDWWMAEWPKIDAMRDAFKIIEEEPRLKPTPWVFGGNMVIHRDIFRRIAFDPNVRRGEDIDFLTNCKFFEIDFLLDNQLAIKHLQPASSGPAWKGFREDLYRFVYAREKLRRQVPGACPRLVTVEDLDPYPGRLMRDDLEELIYRTCVLTGLNYMHSSDSSETYEVGFIETMRNIFYARYDAPPDHDPFQWYLEFRERWEQLMGFLATDDYMSKELLGAM